ncbi:MAG: RNA-binding protein [Candidatus Neomarinimicrobiota bacterium]
MNIYVGNISFQTDESGLETAFSEFGAVDSARIITDRATGRSKGFGFVEMPNQAEGEKAIQELNGKEMEGRELKVNEARPREDKPRRPRY